MADKKETQAQLADRYNVTRMTISRWKNEGIDIHNSDEVANHSRKSSSMLQGDLFAPEGSVYEQIDQARNKDEAVFIKTKIEARKLQLQFEITQGDYIKNSEVKEGAVRILSILKAGMQKLESDLPNKLYGLQASDIQKEIRAANDKLLTQFAELAKEEFGE